METLIAKLVEAYRQSISELDWMSDETKQQALVKLSKFRPKIGYAFDVKEGDGMWLPPEDRVRIW